MVRPLSSRSKQFRMTLEKKQLPLVKRYIMSDISIELTSTVQPKLGFSLRSSLFAVFSLTSHGYNPSAGDRTAPGPLLSTWV